MVKYIKIKRPRGGVKRRDGTGRSCMNCRKSATTTAVRKDGKMVMDIWLCDDHAKYAKSLG
jgi:hypothetical protein